MGNADWPGSSAVPHVFQIKTADARHFESWLGGGSAGVEAVTELEKVVNVLSSNLMMDWSLTTVWMAANLHFRL
jgi:hypothetical protein